MLKKSTVIETVMQRVKEMLHGEEQYSSDQKPNSPPETETLAKSIAGQKMACTLANPWSAAARRDECSKWSR